MCFVLGHFCLFGVVFYLVSMMEDSDFMSDMPEVILDLGSDDKLQFAAPVSQHDQTMQTIDFNPDTE